jgi:hypothetical protein
MALQAGLVLDLGGFSRVLTIGNQYPYTPPAAGSHMIASGTMASLAGPPLHFVSRVEQKNLPHQRVRKFFELGGVAGLANVVADVSRLGSGGFGFSSKKRRIKPKENEHDQREF